MASNPPQALRLTLAYQGGQVTVVGSERVAMIVPATIAEQPAAGQTGYWFAVIDDAGRVLYHRPLHQPIRIDVEAFAPDPQQSIARVATATRDGWFTVLIPDIPEAHAFELHGPVAPERPDEPARPLLRMGIDALRRMKPPANTGGPAPASGTPPRGTKP